jgi:hypothetical protein
MKGGTHSRFNGDFCSGLGKKDLFFAVWFCLLGGSRWLYESLVHFTLCSTACSDNYGEPSDFCSAFSPGFHRMDIPLLELCCFTVSRRIIDYW